jgi:shikimate dehydrogenase
MTDGAAFVDAIRAAGCKPEGLRALLIGAGGAGSAIAAALLDAGVVELAIHDIDHERRDSLLGRLSTQHPTTALRTGSADPSGFDLVANASTAGLQEKDPLPIMIERLAPGTFVGDVQTVSAVPPLIEAARRIGCPTQTGLGMFEANRERLWRFLLGDRTQAG